MSEELKKRLDNYEEQPPEKNWERIAAALDKEMTAEFPKRLYDLEINPPVGAWEKIAEGLSQENYSSKLYNFEVAPPESSWEKISSDLDKEKPIPIHSKRRIPPLVKYAAASCVFALVAFGAFKLFSTETEHDVAAVTIVPQKNTVPEINKDSIPDQTTVADNHLPKEEFAMAATAVSGKKNLPQQTSYMTQLATPPDENTNLSSDCAFQEAILREDVPGNCATISESDPYLMFMNPNGYLIRISKKLAHALGCLNTDTNSENDNPCEAQMTKWRDKIAQSSGSSPDNFMNVLDIIKSVDK